VVHNYRESAAKGRSFTHSGDDYARLLWGEPGSRVTGQGFKPQVIVLNPGANDFTGPVYPAEVFEEGYRKLILQVRHLNPKAVYPVPGAGTVPVSRQQTSY
jgi:lysophospholipase L1-like esterase